MTPETTSNTFPNPSPSSSLSIAIVYGLITCLAGILAGCSPAPIPDRAAESGVPWEIAKSVTPISRPPQADARLLAISDDGTTLALSYDSITILTANLLEDSVAFADARIQVLRGPVTAAFVPTPTLQLIIAGNIWPLNRKPRHARGLLLNIACESTLKDTTYRYIDSWLGRITRLGKQSMVVVKTREALVAVDPSSLEVKRELALRSTEVRDFQCSADGSQVAIAYADGSLEILDWVSQKLVQRTTLDRTLNVMAPSWTEGALVFLDANGELCRYDRRTDGRVRCIGRAGPYAGSVAVIGSVAAVTDIEGVVRLWRLDLEGMGVVVRVGKSLSSNILNDRQRYFLVHADDDLVWISPEVMGEVKRVRLWKGDAE